MTFAVEDQTEELNITERVLAYKENDIPEIFGPSLNGFPVGHPKALYSFMGESLSDGQARLITSLLKAKIKEQQEITASVEQEDNTPTFFRLNQDGTVEALQEDILIKECPYPNAYIPDFHIDYPPSTPYPKITVCVYPNGEIQPGQIIADYDGEGRIISFVPEGYVLDFTQFYGYIQNHFQDFMHPSNISITSFANIVADALSLLNDPRGSESLFFAQGTPLEFQYNDGNLDITDSNGTSILEEASDMDIRQAIFYALQSLKTADSVGLQGVKVTENMPASDIRAQNQEISGNLMLVPLIISIIIGGYIFSSSLLEKLKSKSQPSSNAS